MDTTLQNQLQFYTPPQVVKELFRDSKACYKVAKLIIDREYRARPQKWKTQAFPEYEDFFQAAIAGFNPYKKANMTSRDKGLLQAIQTYDPYRKSDNDAEQVILKIHNHIEQAFCPYCDKRGEEVSLWPASAGNKMDPNLAPDPLFFKGNKYCGRIVSNISEEWIREGLVREVEGVYFCNFKNRLASVKNYISSQIGFLIQDIRSAEYHSSRSVKKHPFYPCPCCNTLNPDFSSNKVESLDCTNCGFNFSLKEFTKKSNQSKIIWQARGSALGDISIDNIADDHEGRSSFEDVIAGYNIYKSSDQAIHHNTIEIERSRLMEELLRRIRILSLQNLTSKQYKKLLEDPQTIIIDGIPETQSFQIFYNYFFMDDQQKKKTHEGKANNKSDESSTYRELALRYLKKEQHYTRCLTCNHKMYEPTESAKFKKHGHHLSCTECTSKRVKYHGPHCGQPDSLDPSCREHGDIEIVMYIFQTIEPKIRRLEEIVKKDPVAKDLYERIKELAIARDEVDAFQDMIKLLNY